MQAETEYYIWSGLPTIFTMIQLCIILKFLYWSWKAFEVLPSLAWQFGIPHHILLQRSHWFVFLTSKTFFFECRNNSLVQHHWQLISAHIIGGFKVGASWLACQLASCLARFFWQADLPACRQVKLLYTPLPTFIIFFHSSLHGSIAERLAKWQASQLASTLSPAIISDTKIWFWVSAVDIK